MVAQGVWQLGGRVGRRTSTTNANEQEQRNFELVKLRIAFLQHIATLSGAAIVIILALVERGETA